jgi:sporulation protein YlmC with PRC-barrel domain
VRLSDETIRGKVVIGADGQVVGVVAALFLNSDAWRIESLQVTLRREAADFLGAPHGLFHAGSIEIPVGMVQSVGDTVVLSVEVHDLRQLLTSEAQRASATSSSASSAPSS